MKILSLVIQIFVVLALNGCVTNPMTGRSQLALISEESVIEKSTSMYTDMVSALDEKGKISTDEVLKNRVAVMTNRLVERAILYRPETAKWNWQVNVVDDPEVVNASCMPGGKMVLYTGLINKIQPTDDELAQVMGHEISHALANHGVEKMSNQILGRIAVAAVGVAVASSEGSNTHSVRTAQQLGSVAAAAFITLPNSRGAESEADKLGLEIAAQAGYDPAAAITLWGKMAEVSGQKSRGDFWSTHPSPPNRIDSLNALQEPMQKIFASRKGIYNSEYVAQHQYVKMGGDDFADSSNVRIVTEGETSLQASPYVDPTQALAFYSPTYEAFQNGTLELDCKNCGFKFYSNQSELKSLYEKQDWRGLAQEVSDINYNFDLSYLYLGLSAEGLGLIESAKNYFIKAIELSKNTELSCSGGKFIKCNDFDVSNLAASKID